MIPGMNHDAIAAIKSGCLRNRKNVFVAEALRGFSRTSNAYHAATYTFEPFFTLGHLFSNVRDFAVARRRSCDLPGNSSSANLPAIAGSRTWWVVSAKRPETRCKGLERLIQQYLSSAHAAPA